MYFSQFPYITYDSSGNENYKIVTNLLKRVGLRTKVKTNTMLYDTYEVKEGETPESIADKLYDDSELHWVILMVNDITDRYHQWPMKVGQFNDYLKDKYDNIDGIHHYEVYQKSGDTSIKIEVANVSTDYASASKTFNASTAVSGEYITISSHALSKDDEIIYSANGGTPIPQLEESGVYFVKNISEDIVLEGTDINFERLLLDGIDANSSNADGKITLEDGDHIITESSDTHTRDVGSNVQLETGSGVLLGENTTNKLRLSKTKNGGVIGLTTGSDESHILGVKSTSIGDTAAIRITNREYEENRQDELRRIRLLNPVYIEQFVTEFETLMNESIL